MARAIAAIVGRPNVGKSTLVNRLAAGSRAIVDSVAGVTRDRNYIEADWRGRDFILIDTGGLDPGGREPMTEAIKGQAMAAVDEADLIIFVLDAKTGLTAVDEEIAGILRKAKKPLLVVVNKVDNPAHYSIVSPFFKLGLGDPLPVSASHGLMVGELLDEIVEKLPALMALEVEAGETRVAIVGRPNAGKSSLFNRLIGAERAVVSEVPGTTRDAIDTIVSAGDQRYRFIDTAGLRRIAKLSGNLEYYGILRAVKALEDASVAILVVDSAVGVTDQDQRVARLAAEKRCALIIMLNKWDLIDAGQADAVQDQLVNKLRFVDYAIVIKTSATTGRGVKKTFSAIDQVMRGFDLTVSTPAINKFLAELRSLHTPTRKGKSLKLRYGTQLKVGPPAFLIFVNDPRIVDAPYRRFIEKRFRERFNLIGTPVNFFFRKGN